MPTFNYTLNFKKAYIRIVAKNVLAGMAEGKDSCDVEKKFQKIFSMLKDPVTASKFNLISFRKIIESWQFEILSSYRI